MGLKVFLAGATGVISRSLIPLLRDAGHSMTGMTRTAKGREKLQSLGIEAVIVDVFDREKLRQAVIAAAPAVVIHQLTDLSAGLDSAIQAEVLTRNARLRREGTANLVDAAWAAGAKRLIAQSIAWAYAPKDPPYQETDPLDATASGLRGISVGKGVIPLETAVLGQPDMEGVVLRYGELYGPGTWSAEPTGPSPVHVDAAAYAAFLAIDHGLPGAYNIAEPGGAVVIDKATTQLAWRPDFRLEQHA
jgi:nucleoside-diphosphate-sugar epimerase